MTTMSQILIKIEELIKGQIRVEQGLSRLETRQTVLEDELKEQKGELLQAIKDSQEDTIESISELMNFGYDTHKKRIVRIEDHLNLPPLKR